METDYSSPVYKVLLQPRLFGGIGIVPFVAIIFVTILLANTVSKWFLVVGVLAYLIIKNLCKKDPLLLTIFFNRILQPNIWRA